MMSRSPIGFCRIALALIFSVLACQSYAASVVPDWNVPGIPDAGFPHFENDVRVNFQRKGGGYELTATELKGSESFFRLGGDEFYFLHNSDFVLKATFDRFLKFTGGLLTISGRIPDLGLNAQTTLLDATLTDFGVDLNPFDDSPIALAFRTSNLSGWASQFSNGADESIYLTGIRSLDLFGILFGRGISFNATAITTVPVPAAAWLLGSGLIALLGVGGGFRRKAEEASVAV